MAKKKILRKKSVKKVTISPEIRYLEILMKFSLRAITDQNSSVDRYFQDQANRFEEQIRKLKEKQ
jgi:hypothetical protein